MLGSEKMSGRAWLRREVLPKSALKNLMNVGSARTELGSSMSAFQKVPFAIRDGVHLASAGGDRVCTRGNACARLSHTFGVLRGQLMATI
ncbi:hypothetical protein [Bradyrhizobium elkanii]|uniref:hypothetical protein n=1 Tax=Bradyrhizobium elkanii TaxID=29448 RepID=UPI0011443E95|nr:hypothetical protein [Bradyrhizobium elkanii]